MTVSRTTREVTVAEERAIWRSKNRGAISQTARKFDVSYTFVRRVLIGELSSEDRRVEKELARLGCPGFAETK